MEEQTAVGEDGALGQASEARTALAEASLVVENDERIANRRREAEHQLQGGAVQERLNAGVGHLELRIAAAGCGAIEQDA